MAAKSKSKIKSLLDGGITRTPVEQLSKHPMNPNVGDIDSIADSLDENEQFQPVRVQKSTGYIIGGWHTYLAAMKLGWTHVDTVVLDVDDNAAKRIMLADNKTRDRAKLDPNKEALLLADLGGISGTGYDQDEFDKLLALVATEADRASVQALVDIENAASAPSPVDPWAERETDNRASSYGGLNTPNSDVLDVPSADLDNDPKPETPAEENKMGDLQVVLERREGNNFKGRDRWGIPELLPEGLMQEVPAGLVTWGGHDVTEVNDGESYFYNYGLGGVRGLPWDRTILSFFTHDDKFDHWYVTPGFLTAKFLIRGLKYVVVPDFSFYEEDPRVLNLMNVYRAQWMGRFFQESGLKVIPRLQFAAADPDSLEIALLGIPKGVPVLAASQQNIEDEKVKGPRVTALLKAGLEAIQPGHLIFYGAGPGRRALAATGWDGPTTILDTYSTVRRGIAYDRKEGKMVKNPRAKMESDVNEDVDEPENEDTDE